MKGGDQRWPQQVDYVEQTEPDALAEAIGQCAAGERDALRAIYQSEGARMVAVAQRIVRRRDLAEEIAQEAFVQLWTKAGQYAPDRGSARGWIYAIVRNRALNHIRDTRREQPADAAALEARQAAPEPIDCEDIFDALDRRSRLYECLAQLDRKRRACVLMAYVYGYTHGEIAGRLRAPLGTAKAWVRRGLAALRECLS